MSEILSKIKNKLNADSSHIEISFIYFIEKKSPISKIKSLIDYNCKFIASDKNNEYDFILEVEVPVTTLCPCSKQISDMGAHNQRSHVKVQVRWIKTLIWIEDLIKIVEESSSAPLYSLLKREDEKFVTEQAYNNPMFVEDMVREISLKLIKDENIKWFKVESLNHESIHNHDAYAAKEWMRE